jgi:hypothetical protein
MCSDFLAKTPYIKIVYETIHLKVIVDLVLRALVAVVNYICWGRVGRISF